MIKHITTSLQGRPHMNENEQEKKKTKNSYQDLKIWSIVSFLFVFIMVFGYLAYFNLHNQTSNKAYFSDLSNSFSVISTLFSGLAFSGLIVTIAMQHKTMKAQMDELELARKEYTRQGAALEGQENAMKAQLKRVQVQQYELTLYKLIDFKKNASLEMLADEDLSVINEIKNKFSDKISLDTNYFKNLKENSVEIYFRRVVGVFKHLSSINESSVEVSVLKDMVMDSFSREELRAIIVFLSENKNASFRDFFEVIFNSGIDFKSIFKLNLISDLYLSSKNGDFLPWYEHDEVLRIVEFLFVEVSKGKNKYYEIGCFYNDYLNDLNSKVEELEMFGSIGNFNGDSQNYISIGDIKDRIESIKEKILPLTLACT